MEHDLIHKIFKFPKPVMVFTFFLSVKKIHFIWQAEIPEKRKKNHTLHCLTIHKKPKQFL